MFRTMLTAPGLMELVEIERDTLIRLVENLSQEQAAYKPAPERWSVNENLEHLVLAEVSGVSKIWAAADGIRNQRPVWVGEHTNKGLPIEVIIARTWKDNEVAPPIATPHIGGPLSYWIAYLRLSRDLLLKLQAQLDGLDLQKTLFPHFLCGPLDAGQRLEFLRFHIARHRRQIEAVLSDPNFPKQ